MERTLPSSGRPTASRTLCSSENHRSHTPWALHLKCRSTAAARAGDSAIRCVGLSQVDSIVKRVRYYPDGTKKRGSEVKDKRRDKYYQLARLLVDKYNDHHNLFGDLAYEVKDFLHGKPLWEDYYIHWTYFHMNFIAKAKGSYGVDIGNLFFAEVKYMRGDDGLTVNSCCILEPSDDHGLCYGCGADMKHPNDGNTYACGRRNISYHFQNGAPELPPGYCNDRYYEDSDEEVERLRSQFKEK
ncbi:hypothetical protein ZWY2020_031151 [Hordeum vulgare]|nr:hypothetical protein ZWY2020_031151 [Hordeum vulgare]